MVSPPPGVSILVLGGVLLLVIVVVGSLIAAAVLQYRRAQEGIAERRAEREAAEAADAERQAETLRLDAELSQVGFLSERTRVREERAALVEAARGQGGTPGGATARRGAGATTEAAAGDPSLQATPLLLHDAWRPARPLRLDPGAGEVRVQAVDDPGPRPAPALREALAAWRPRTGIAPRYPRHVHVVDAIVELEDPPAGRYVDRDCYRVLGLTVDGEGLQLELGRTSYFAALEEAVPLECDVARVERAAASRAAGEEPAEPTPLRGVIADPFDLAARTAVASVSTLVLRREADGSAEFWLHRRRAVGMVGGQVHVVPTGVFQPAIDELPEVFARDADPWWTVVREAAEELLGMWNVDERALAPDVYASLEPLAAIEQARLAGEARPWFLGAGLDPLSLWVELLTVLVVDAPAFDRIIGQPPRENGEGTLVGRTRADGSFGGLPFTAGGIREALGGEALAPAADALLRLAWAARDSVR